jgi:hypothetical protein
VTHPNMSSGLLLLALAAKKGKAHADAQEV